MNQDLEEKLRGILGKYNFVLGKKIGEGYFREVYEVIRKKGTLKKKFVAKIEQPKDCDSVQHKINISKKGLSEREIEILSTLNHPNIVQIYDVLEEEGMQVTIEENFNAISLEDRIKIQGPIVNAPFLEHIFLQIQEALRHLHTERKILHRDIKPSNILISNETDTVKMTDFQNAAFYGDISARLLPTRGATAYTHPDLINTLLTGELKLADIATEFYALGVSLFYTLTGMTPFNYQLAFSEQGVPIEIDNKNFLIALQQGAEKIPMITIEAHEKILEERMEDVPEQYRELLRNCLSLDRRTYSLNAEEAHARFKEGLVKATSYKYPNINQDFLDKEILSSIANHKDTSTSLPVDSKLSVMINKMVEIVKERGLREKEVYFEHHEDHDDIIHSRTKIERYAINLSKLDVLVEDSSVSLSGETDQPGSRETYSRTFKIFFEKELVLETLKQLGNEECNWSVKKLEDFDNFIQKKYVNYIERGSIGELHWLYGGTKINLSNDIYQHYVNTFIRRGETANLRGLDQLNGIRISIEQYREAGSNTYNGVGYGIPDSDLITDIEIADRLLKLVLMKDHKEIINDLLWDERYGFVLTASDTLEGALDTVNKRVPAKNGYGLPSAIVYQCWITDKTRDSSLQIHLQGEPSLNYDVSLYSAREKSWMIDESVADLSVSVYALYHKKEDENEVDDDLDKKREKVEKNREKLKEAKENIIFRKPTN